MFMGGLMSLYPKTEADVSKCLCLTRIWGTLVFSDGGETVLGWFFLITFRGTPSFIITY